MSSLVRTRVRFYSVAVWGHVTSAWILRGGMETLFKTFLLGCIVAPNQKKHVMGFAQGLCYQLISCTTFRSRVACSIYNHGDVRFHFAHHCSYDRKTKMETLEFFFLDELYWGYKRIRGKMCIVYNFRCRVWDKAEREGYKVSSESFKPRYGAA